MNPLCFSFVAKRQEDWPSLLAEIRAAGFEGIEPTFWLQDALPNGEAPVASARELKAVAEPLGLKIPSMRGGPAFWGRFASPDKELRREAVEIAEKAIEALTVLGGDVLLLVPGMWTDEQDHASMWAHAAETARQIGDLARSASVTVALENVENDFLCSPREWSAFLEEVDHPAVRMYLDVGNPVRNRQGPPAQWLRTLGPRWVKRIHFKGSRHGGPLTALLDGDVPWPRVANAIREIGYMSWIGIELDPPPHSRELWLKNVCHAARGILAE